MRGSTLTEIQQIHTSTKFVGPSVLQSETTSCFFVRYEGNGLDRPLNITHCSDVRRRDIFSITDEYECRCRCDERLKLNLRDLYVSHTLEKGGCTQECVTFVDEIFRRFLFSKSWKRNRVCSMFCTKWC
jgi:hypothetical protein